MGNTPHGSWAGCASFGLRELLEESKNRPERAQLALEELNRALASLGITHVRVERIQKEAQLVGAENLEVELVSKTDPAKVYSLRAER